VFPEPGSVVLETGHLAPPGPGQVLLRSEKSLISTGTELTALTGDFPPGSRWAAYIQYPVGAGYSSVARVEAVGEGVDRVCPGERVTSWAPHATHALRSAEQLWLVPEAVDSVAASFATLAEIV